MANTHGESSLEEFAAKALPELESLLERFNDLNKPDEPGPEPVNENKSDEPEPEPVKHDDADDGDERVKELAHIIWHLANHMEEIAFHEGGICTKVIGDIQNVRRQVAYINDFLGGLDDEPGF